MLATAQDNQPGWIRRLDELHLLTPLRILTILLVAIVLSLLVRVLVRRLLRRTLMLAGRFERNEARHEARQRALASAMRSGLVGVIWMVTVITIISQLGINIGAFVATATVVGGAIAFGAQTLIRDVIGGLFVLAEDQYGVGDVVDLGHATGTVERITLRTARLRDNEGRIWYVSHGNVMRVANLSKASTARLTVEVARSTTPTEVSPVLHDLCAQLTADPDAAPDLDGEPSVVGLTEVHDDRLVYVLLAPTKPGAQARVRRAWQVLALAAFADGRLRAPVAPPTVDPDQRGATPAPPPLQG